MSNKPSLYVVEKKEVVVLVLLFVLVTVLAFTLGVKYGESIGRKALNEGQAAHKELENELAGRGGSGTIAGAGEHGAAAPEAAGEPVAIEGEHGAEAAPEHAAEGHEAAAGEGHGTAEKKADAHAEEHGAEHPAEHGAAADSPEAAATGHKAEEVAKPGLKDRPKEPVDSNSDQHLLEALTEAGIEAPKKMGAKAGSKAEGAKSLPEEAKSTVSGSFTIQVGSYPTKNDADQQLRHLKAEHVANASVLAPVSDKSGEWYRVVVGSFKTKAEAERAAKAEKDKGTIKTYFVRKLN